MLGSLTRSLRLQYAMNRDVIHLGGIAFIYMNADHLIIKRTEMKLRMLGLYHNGGNMTSGMHIPQ